MVATIEVGKGGAGGSARNSNRAAAHSNNQRESETRGATDDNAVLQQLAGGPPEPASVGVPQQRPPTVQTGPDASALTEAAARAARKQALKQSPAGKRSPPRQTHFASPTSANLPIEQVIKTVTHALRQKYRAKKSLRAVFRGWDENHDGHVDQREMQKIFDSMGLNHLTEAQVGAIHRACDPDGSGALEYDEFIDMVFDHDGAAGGAHEGEGLRPGPEGHKVMMRILRQRLGEDGMQSTKTEAYAAAQTGKFRCTAKNVIPRLRDKYTQKASLKDVFRAWDDNKDGHVSVDELAHIVHLNGFVMDRSELQALFDRFDKDGGGNVEYAEFCNLVFPEQESVKSESVATESEYVASTARSSLSTVSSIGMREEERHVDKGDMSVDAALRALRLKARLQKKVYEHRSRMADAFRDFDVNHDGVVSRSEFRAAIKKMKLGFSNRDVDALLLSIDADNSGKIEYVEFARQLMATVGGGGGRAQLGGARSRPGTGGGLLPGGASSSSGLPGGGQGGGGGGGSRPHTAHSSRPHTAGAGLDRIMPTRGGMTMGRQKLNFNDVLGASHLRVNTRSGRRPKHSTTFLITGGAPDAEGRFRPESRQYGGGAGTGYFQQDHALRRRRRREARIARRQAHEQKLTASVAPRREADHFFHEKRVNSMMRQRLSYFERLASRFEKDRRRMNDPLQR